MKYTIDKKTRTAIVTVDMQNSNWQSGVDFLKHYGKHTPESRGLFSFQYKTKKWTAPVTPDMESDLVDAGFEGQKYIDPSKLIFTKEVDFSDEELDEDLLPETIRDYQVDTLKWAIARDLKGLISLEAGLGKSLTSIILAAHYSWNKPLLVVCPASVKKHWQREFKKWAGMDAKILKGTKPRPITNEYEVYIINYDILKDWEFMLEKKCSGVIADECQYLSNPRTKRSKGFYRIQRSCGFKLFLSGTPISKRPIQFWNVLRMLDKKVWGNESQYIARYCPETIGYNGEVTNNGAANLDELHTRIKPYIFRKLKEEVAKELPEKVKTVYELECADTLVAKADRELQEAIDNGEHDKASIQERIKELSRSSYFATRKAMHEVIDNYLDSTVDKITIVGYHKAVVEDLAKKYNAPYINGSISADKRQGIVDEFQTNPNQRVLILQFEACAEGLNIPEASAMFFAEMYYNPAKLMQIEDRIHRLTSTWDSVFYYYFFLEGSVLGRMFESLDKESRNITQIMDGERKSAFEGAEYSDLFFD